MSMNERVSMGFKFFAAVENRFWCAAEFALRFTPSMLHALEPDIALVAFEALGDGVFAHRAFRAIDAAAGE